MSYAWRPVGQRTCVGLVCTLLAIAAIGVWFASKRTPRESAEQAPANAIRTSTVQQVTGALAWSELAGVRDGLDELSIELDALAAQVSLLDETQEVESLLARYSLDDGINQ